IRPFPRATSADTATRAITGRTACKWSSALIITPDGLPLAYEVLPGHTSDKTTLKGFLERIEAQYGKAERVWLMDRGVPTEEVLAQMRASDPPTRYLVGTPKGRLSKLEKELLDKPWRQARLGVQVKIAAEGRRAPRLRRERRSPRQGTQHAPAATERALEKTQRAFRHDALTPGASDEARRRARSRPHRLAAHRHRRRRERPNLPLSPRSRQAASGAKTRGPLSAAHQSRRRRPRQIVELLSPVRPH